MASVSKLNDGFRGCDFQVKSRAVSVLNKMLQLRSGRASESGMSGRSRLKDSSALNDCTLNRCLPAYEKVVRSFHLSFRCNRPIRSRWRLSHP